MIRTMSYHAPELSSVASLTFMPNFNTDLNAEDDLHRPGMAYSGTPTQAAGGGGNPDRLDFKQHDLEMAGNPSSGSPIGGSLFGKPSGGNPSGVHVKEEPLEEEDQGLVIDLTPQSSSPFPPGSHKAGSSDSLPSPRHHPYTRPAVTGDRDFSNTQGNIPSHLDSAKDSSMSSDSDLNAFNTTDKPDVFTGTFRFSVPKNSIGSLTQPRAKREFVPEFKKDDSYWCKRQKNNVSARRSRMKRKTLEKVMEHRVIELEQENIQLKYELKALKRMFGDKINTDLTSSPSESPVSSPSSGLGTSQSSLSSTSGSAEHSTSSSPVLNTEEDRIQKTPYNLKVKLTSRDTEDSRMEDSGESSQGNDLDAPISVPKMYPPAAHSQLVSQGYSFACPPSSRIDTFPPVAHTAFYGMPPAGCARSYINFTPPSNQGSPLPAHLYHLRPTLPPAGTPTPPSWYRDYLPKNDNHYALTSPGPSGSPKSGTSSEEDGNISSDFRRSSRSDCDDEVQQKVCKFPPKFRFKRDMHTAFTVAS